MFDLNIIYYEMIIVRIWEGLGNQMFQYAFAKSFQKRTGIKVYLDCEKSYNESLPGANTHVSRDYALDNFNIKLDKIKLYNYKRWDFLSRKNKLEKLLCFLSINNFYPFRFIIDNKHVFSVNRKLLSLKGNCYIMGWFQNEMYFSDIRNELLRDFTPSKKIKVSRQLKQIINYDNLVSIHIRRGDYLKSNLSIGLKYYYLAIDYVCSKIENPIFLIFSDDVNWVKKNLTSKCCLYYIDDLGEYKDFEQLYIMSKCKHNIIANSTFSWWGAWLNQNPNKIVVTPNKWWHNDLESLNLVLKEWIMI